MMIQKWGHNLLRHDTKMTMNYRQELLPVRDLIMEIEKRTAAITDPAEYDRVYTQLCDANVRLQKCIDARPSDARVTETITKLSRSMESTRYFIAYSMLRMCELARS